MMANIKIAQEEARMAREKAQAVQENADKKERETVLAMIMKDSPMI